MSESAEGGSLLGTIKLYTGGGGVLPAEAEARRAPPPCYLPRLLNHLQSKEIVQRREQTGGRREVHLQSRSISLA